MVAVHGEEVRKLCTEIKIRGKLECYMGETPVCDDEGASGVQAIIAKRSEALWIVQGIAESAC